MRVSLQSKTLNMVQLAILFKPDLLKHYKLLISCSKIEEELSSFIGIQEQFL